MGILDFIKKLFTNNKKNPKIIVNKLIKTYGTDTPLEVALYDDKTPLTDKSLFIQINGREYERKTDNEGIAKLNINLPVGEYPCYIDFYETEQYNSTNAYTTVIVKSDTRMEGTDIQKTASETAVYQCAVYDKDNNRLTNTTVDLSVNGVTYNKPLESDGLAKLNIRLGTGNYTIKATFNGTKLYNSSNVTNTITVTDDPKPTPTPTPQKSRSEKILDEFEKYFGKCEYIDDALSKVKGKGYAFYFSDGYNMYDTIKRIANGKGANCYDSAEVFYHLMLGMNTKYGRKYEPQYLHVWCPVSNYDHIRLRFKSNSQGWYYRDPASVLNGGAVESNWCGTSNNILEVNPSFIIDG